jgi:hypothetical protein
MSASLLTLTSLAVAVSVARAEEVMPRLHEEGPMLMYQRRDSGELILSESAVVFHLHWLQPELSRLPFARHVDVHWFAAIAGKEEESVRPALKNCRTHRLDSVSFPQSRQGG